MVFLWWTLSTNGYAPENKKLFSFYPEPDDLVRDQGQRRSLKYGNRAAGRIYQGVRFKKKRPYGEYDLFFQSPQLPINRGDDHL